MSTATIVLLISESNPPECTYAKTDEQWKQLSSFIRWATITHLPLHIFTTMKTEKRTAIIKISISHLFWTTEWRVSLETFSLSCKHHIEVFVVMIDIPVMHQTKNKEIFMLKNLKEKTKINSILLFSYRSCPASFMLKGPRHQFLYILFQNNNNF